MSSSPAPDVPGTADASEAESLTDPGGEATLPTGPRRATGTAEFVLTRVALPLVALWLTSVIVFLVLQRYLVQGVEQSGID